MEEVCILTPEEKAKWLPFEEVHDQLQNFLDTLPKNNP